MEDVPLMQDTSATDGPFDPYAPIAVHSEESVPPNSAPIVVGAPDALHPLGMRDVECGNRFYSLEVAHAITDKYIEGSSISKICQEPGMPSYGTVMRWLKTKDEFRELMDASRELRAYHMEEAALEAADAPMDKDEVPQARLRYDSRVWAASVHNPERYGRKTTISGDSKRPIVFNVSTGVPDSAPKEIEVAQADVLKEVTEKVIEAEEVDGAVRPCPSEASDT